MSIIIYFTLYYFTIYFILEEDACNVAECHSTARRPTTQPAQPTTTAKPANNDALEVYCTCTWYPTRMWKYIVRVPRSYFFLSFLGRRPL